LGPLGILRPQFCNPLFYGPNLCVPFFTTKGGSGTGLGLVISHRIVVERHSGKIDFTTGPNGTQFNVRLPFESPAHA
jgi:signal transduction histidine kinase